MKQKTIIKGAASGAGGHQDQDETGIKFASPEAFEKALSKVMTLHAGLLKKLA